MMGSTKCMQHTQYNAVQANIMTCYYFQYNAYFMHFDAMRSSTKYSQIIYVCLLKSSYGKIFDDTYNTICKIFINCTQNNSYELT